MFDAPSFAIMHTFQSNANAMEPFSLLHSSARPPPKYQLPTKISAPSKIIPPSFSRVSENNTEQKMGGQKAEQSAEPDFFMDDPIPPSCTQITPEQYRATAEYSSSKAIVLDLGSSTLRAGFSRCSEPLMQLPPYVARLRDPKTGIRTFLVGTDALTSSARSTAKPAYKAGLPNNPALMERLIDGTLVGLGLAEEQRVDHSFILTEAPMQPNSARALLMELIFEAYEAPSICFGIDALFSYAWNTKQRDNLLFPERNACVLSCGYNNTHVLPLVNGKLYPSGVQRINVGGSHMTNQLTRRLQLLNQEHAGVLTTSRCELLKERVCYVSEDYSNELRQIQTDVNYYNGITRIIKVPTGDGAEKPPISAEEKERLKQARSENGRRLSELMKEKRKAKKEKGSGTDEPKEDKSLTEEDTKTLYGAIQDFYQLKRLEEMRELDEDGFYLALSHLNIPSRSALLVELEKREEKLEQEREKLGETKSRCAEETWWKKVHEDELLSMSDTDLNPGELKRKRQIRAWRGAAEARERAKKAKEAQKAEEERRAEEKRRMKKEQPKEYLAELQTERKNLAGRIKKRQAAKAAGSDRRSQAARERMRLLAEHAGNKSGFEDGPPRGKGRGRGRGRKWRGRGRGRGRGGRRAKAEIDDDNFGWNDSDWDVYRSMRVGGNDSDSEDNSGDDRDRLQAVREEINELAPDEVDPTISRPEGVALLYEDNKCADEFTMIVDRIRTPELIFQPTLAGVEQCGLIEALRLGVGNRSDIVKEVFLTGGVSYTPGLRKRICAELRRCFPAELGEEIVGGVRFAEDACLDAWKGAALFAEEGGELFERACISKSEYEEMGNGYLKEHAFSNVFIPTPILSASDMELKKKMQKQASKRGRSRSLLG